MGKLQAIPRADTAQAMADRIFTVLAKTDSCKTYITGGLVSALDMATTHASARQTTEKIAEIQSLISPDQINRMLFAATKNSQVREADQVYERLKQIAKTAGVSIPREDGRDIPF
jgi:hypothetical protein